MGDSDIERLAALETASHLQSEHLQQAVAEDRRFRELIMEKLEAVQRPVPRWQLASLMFAMAVFLGGAVWAASRYSERSEFEDLSRRLSIVQVNQQLLTANLADLRDHIHSLEQK